MGTGRGGLGDAPWNFAEFMENFIGQFGYNPFVGTGIGPSEGDIPNVAMAPELGDDGYPVDIDPVLKQFLVIFSKYIESQDTDDIDRIYLQEEANEWTNLYNKYLNKEITLEQLKEFQPDYLTEIPGWNDYYQGIIGGGEEGTEEETVDPQEQELIDKWGKKVVDDFKQKYEDIVSTIGEVADDPWGAIGSLISSTSTTGGPCWEGAYGGREWVRNCVTIGVLYGIPGLPLPPIPGVAGATIGEIEDAFKKVGANVQDILDGAETCGEDTDGDGVGNELCTWEDAFTRAKDWIIEKVEEGIEGITNPDDIDDWITGILGPILGGAIFEEVGDQISDILFPVTDINDDDTTKCTEGTLDPVTNLCICADGSIEAEDGTCVEVGDELSVCKDPNALNYDEEGECKYADQPTICEDPEATNTGEEGECQYAQTDSTPTNSIDELCSQPRPEEFGFGQINWDKYCSGGGDVVDTQPDCENNPEATPLECGWVECPEGGFAPTEEECGTPAEVVPPTSSSSSGGGGGGGGGGGAGAFEGTVRGLSYQPQPVPGLLSGAPVDAMGELNQFISRQLQKRSKGMLT